MCASLTICSPARPRDSRAHGRRHTPVPGARRLRGPWGARGGARSPCASDLGVDWGQGRWPEHSPGSPLTTHKTAKDQTRPISLGCTGPSWARCVLPPRVCEAVRPGCHGRWWQRLEQRQTQRLRSRPRQLSAPGNQEPLALATAAALGGGETPSPSSRSACHAVPGDASAPRPLGGHTASLVSFTSVDGRRGESPGRPGICFCHGPSSSAEESVSRKGTRSHVRPWLSSLLISGARIPRLSGFTASVILFLDVTICEQMLL